MGNILSKKNKNPVSYFFKCNEQLEISQAVIKALKNNISIIPNELLEIIDDYLDSSRLYLMNTLGVTFAEINKLTDREVSEICESDYAKQQILSGVCKKDNESIRQFLSDFCRPIYVPGI